MEITQADQSSYEAIKDRVVTIQKILNDNSNDKTEATETLRDTLDISLRAIELKDQKQAEQAKEIEQLKLKLSQLKHKIETEGVSDNHARLTDMLQQNISRLENERSAQDVQIRGQLAHIKTLERQMQALKKQLDTLKAKPTVTSAMELKRKKEVDGYQIQIEKLKEKLTVTEQAKERLAQKIDQLESELTNEDEQMTYHELYGKYTFYMTENAFLREQLIQLHTRLSEQQLTAKPSTFVDYTIESQRPVLSRFKKPFNNHAKLVTDQKVLLRSSSGLVPPPSNVTQRQKLQKPQKPQTTTTAAIELDTTIIRSRSNSPDIPSSPILPSPSSSLLPPPPSSALVAPSSPPVSISTPVALPTPVPVSEFVTAPELVTESILEPVLEPALSSSVPSLPANKERAKSKLNQSVDVTKISKTSSSIPQKRTVSMDDNRGEEKRQKIVEQKHYEKANSLLESQAILKSEDIKGKMAVSVVAEIDEHYAHMKSSFTIPGKAGLINYGILNVCTITLPKKMDKHEKIYAWYLAMIYKVEPSEFNIILNHLIQKTHDASMQKASASIFKNRFLRLFRLVTVLLRMTDSKERLRVIFYDYLKTPGCAMQMIPCLYNVVVAWKEVFEGDGIMMASIQACTQHIATRLTMPPTVLSIYNRTNTILKWTPLSIKQCIEITMEFIKSDQLKHIFRTNKEKFHQLKFNITRGLELCFIVLNDWKYVYDYIFSVRLWPLLTQEIIYLIVVDLIGTVGRMGIQQSADTKHGVRFIARCLTTVMNQPNPKEIDLKLAAAKSLLNFSDDTSDHKHIVSMLSEVKASFKKK
ncbi:hypothetical protein A0J61_04999 [Choanephora cucurbitarum]|uniref:Uncharacterized protein n=1 Tax=Choanephora cucurbitarum TaxID=101091 RepID=A0A1C7NCX7_9FUNG|nr:hypothetical protein A0J61_04999 [Choanephora cucurbitarum]